MPLTGVDLRKLRIVHYPDPLLRESARPIDSAEIGRDLTALSERMIDLMCQSSGIGLAAPQIGLSVRLIVISLTGKPADAQIYVNPEISDLQGESEMEEGCLSVPGVRGSVRRGAVCRVSAWDIEGSPVTLEAAELAATVFQHETDHLDGTLFIDRLSTLGRLSCRRGIRQLEKEYQPRR